VPDEVVCDRCRALFASLDLARDLCREVADGELPPELREMILRSVG
jgi:hypothetical protein